MKFITAKSFNLAALQINVKLVWLHFVTEITTVIDTVDFHDLVSLQFRLLCKLVK